MKCLACDGLMSDREASRKYVNWKEMPEGEDRYISLCDKCIQDTDLNFVDNPLASNEETINDDSSSESDSTTLFFTTS